jgi:aryl-alcohol dehydrogenase-like predicted oxidoreductase
MIELALGTVQFGLEYGINNKTGKPEKESSLEMLKAAYERGIRYFDTAHAYGNAEELLGEFVERNNLQNKVKIISKLKPNILDGYTGNVAKLVENEIIGSLKKLKIDSLEGYLFHTPEYIYNEELVNALKESKEKGLIKNFGVSIYDEKEALYAANLPVDFIQIPYSVFDQRLNKTNFFEIARKNNITIFARSAFVQGLIFMKDEEIPEHLIEAKAYLKEFDEIIKNYNLTRLEAALLFSYRNKNIDHVVFGVDNLKQLNEDIDIAKNAGNYEASKKCFDELNNRFIDIKKSIIMPSLWKKKK